MFLSGQDIQKQRIREQDNQLARKDFEKHARADQMVKDRVWAASYHTVPYPTGNNRIGSFIQFTKLFFKSRKIA